MALPKPNDGTVLYLEGLDWLLPWDAKRKGRSTPLPWGKFRTAADSTPEGIRYRQQRDAIKTRRDGAAVLGVYDEILAAYGFGQIAPLRGWLVNHDTRAATAAQLAQTIGIRDRNLVARALRALEGVGLLARLPRPDFQTAIAKDLTLQPDGTPQVEMPQMPKMPKMPDTPDDPDDAENQDGSAEGEGTGDGRAYDGENGQKAKETSRGPPGDSGRFQPPASRRPDGGRPVAGKPLGDVRQETGDGQTPPPPGSAAPSPSAFGGTPDPETSAPAAPAPRADGETGDGRTADARGGDVRVTVHGDGSVDLETGEPPDAATGPQDGLCGQALQRASPTTAPPIADEPTEADPRGDEEPSAWAWDTDALAAEIGHTLYPTRDDLVVGGQRCKPPQTAEQFQARERGCLTAAWDAVLALGLAGGQVAAVVESARKKAARLARKPASQFRRSRGAVWRYEFSAHMRAMVGVRWPQANRGIRRRRELGREPSGPPEGG